MKRKEGGTLHHWFKGSKSKDGKPGWVQADGTPCANEPGETSTPKCFSSGRLNRLKRTKRGKSIIRSAVLRKRKKDPGQQQKSGASSPTYVKTFAKGKKDPLYIKAEPKLKESMEIQEARKDIPGKGSGTKDACYHKVKSRFSVWPSAYGSAALVRCRKKGAANWGNKNEEYVYENKKYCPTCMKKGAKCKCSRMPITEARKRDNVTNALLALSFAANVAQSPKDFLRSGHIEGPSMQLMSRMMKSRGKATTSGLDNARVSHPARNKKINENSKEELVKLIIAALSNAKKRKNYLLNYGYIGEAKTPAWSRNAGKDLIKGGLNRKGIASYRRQNPGSKLSMAVTTSPSKLKKGSKSWKRRKSFCSRSAGQMKMWPKAAKDPNSRLRLARRKWNC